MLGFHSISELPISDVQFTAFEVARKAKIETWTLKASNTNWVLPPEDDSVNKPPTRWSTNSSETTWTA
tara:strand:+ start:4310 stop:4513 length:204 start_codon:yes stop_codon:yes gene_type:complete